MLFRSSNQVQIQFILIFIICIYCLVTCDHKFRLICKHVCHKISFFIFGVVLTVFGSLLSTNQIQFCNRSNIFYSLNEIIKVRRCILDIFLMALKYSSYFSNLNNSGFSRFCFFNFWCIIIENTQRNYNKCYKNHKCVNYLFYFFHIGIIYYYVVNVN